MAEAYLRDKKGFTCAAYWMVNTVSMNLYVGVPGFGKDDVERIVEIEMNEPERALFDHPYRL